MFRMPIKQPLADCSSTDSARDDGGDAADALIVEAREKSSAVSSTACWRLMKHPRETIWATWNWKSALLSSLCRGLLFFAANLHVGFGAATSALITEFTYRGLTAGFYGAITQAFRGVRSRGGAALTVGIGLPVVSHTIEFAVHRLRGTPDLRTSIGASFVFTVLSTLFNLHAMRQGVLTVGDGSQSLDTDLRSLPRTVASFLTSGFGLSPAD